MHSSAKFTSCAFQKAFNEQGGKISLKQNPQASARFLARLTDKRKDGFGRGGSSNQDRLGRDAKGMLGSLPVLFRCRFACAKGTNSVAPPRSLGILPPLQIKNAHQECSDFDRYETTAPKSAQKPSLRFFELNLLTRLVGFMPIYLLLRLSFTYFCSHFFAY